MKSRISTSASILIPIPFLVGMVLLMTAFWQNDADFVFGHTNSTEVLLVDQGPAHVKRGRPHFYPTVKMVDGRLLTLERATLATDLPPTNQATQLECSTKNPSNCKFIKSTKYTKDEFIFYGIAILWSIFAVGIAWALWLPLWRKAFNHTKSRSEK